MIVIFDLDGTLANIDHRLPHITKYPKNWDKFYQNIHLDEPKLAIIELYKRFHQANDTIIVCSGRSDICKKETEQWLTDNKLLYSELLMRKHEDRSDDVKVKSNMLKYIRQTYGEPTLVVEDRQRVVDFWRSEKITCLQCDQWEETSTLEKVKKKMIKALQNEGLLKSYSDTIIENYVKKEGEHHGSCCNCPDCGHDKDNCVCSHNEFIKLIDEVFTAERKK